MRDHQCCSIVVCKIYPSSIADSVCTRANFDTVNILTTNAGHRAFSSVH